jgi:hypothetical protein
MMKLISLPYNDIEKTMEHKRKATLFFALLFLSAAILAAGSAMAAKVYRWVDENGEVHYTQTLPPDFEDKKHDELDERGIVRAEDQSLAPPPPEPKPEIDPNELPRDSSGMKRPKALYTEEELQRRMDAFLLLRYSSEQEIRDAMTVEINQLEYDRILLQTAQESMSQTYRGQVREAANRQRSGVEVDSEIINSISDFQNRLEAYGNSLAKLQAREDKIIASFGAELERYQYLMNDQSEES